MHARDYSVCCLTSVLSLLRNCAEHAGGFSYPHFKESKFAFLHQHNELLASRQRQTQTQTPAAHEQTPAPRERRVAQTHLRPGALVPLGTGDEVARLPGGWPVSAAATLRYMLDVREKTRHVSEEDTGRWVTERDRLRRWGQNCFRLLMHNAIAATFYKTFSLPLFLAFNDWSPNDDYPDARQDEPS